MVLENKCVHPARRAEEELPGTPLNQARGDRRRETAGHPVNASLRVFEGIDGLLQVEEARADADSLVTRPALERDFGERFEVCSKRFRRIHEWATDTQSNCPTKGAKSSQVPVGHARDDW